MGDLREGGVATSIHGETHAARYTSTPNLKALNPK